MSAAHSECGNGIMMWFVNAPQAVADSNLCRFKEAKHTRALTAHMHCIHTCSKQWLSSDEQMEMLRFAQCSADFSLISDVSFQSFLIHFRMLETKAELLLLPTFILMVTF